MSDIPFDTIFADTPVVVARLFGSRASGRTHARSDIDIAVLFASETTEEERERWRLESIGRLSDAFRSDAIDLAILNDAPPLLRYEALRPRYCCTIVIMRHGWSLRCAPCRSGSTGRRATAARCALVYNSLQKET
ncbi:MAG: nucleotidyltransferase domain-containing protein [Roseiflexus sp.]|nr:nucleotidyltransferase domain-containing protein [Roseiflexus sp.]MCS7291283.1 nucleotidyltransferase domain-containing protein [Roseiflexus sp.]MDW8145533.1 nucleotidyltransferase domain-containing protein [Roseiflexaceae bacterium]MDW8231452.1 nucleotidyltransferase domain-containing protein [Roseiflexaceae bacterium]